MSILQRTIADTGLGMAVRRVHLTVMQIDTCGCYASRLVWVKDLACS
jgi:hypothetical protein